ncbi:hypothetical protein [Mycobacterium intracellulare]|uniref:hypothetical protein n=1 Tax=Mycobacterium intracellulare TaxID=1767 RepID=UPI001927D489|nr:hypothetical protein [Mycobacterium intracellulare]
MSGVMSGDRMRQKVFLGPEATPDEIHRARVAVCAAADSPEEASMFMKMLGIL